MRKNNSTAAVLQLICPFLLQGTCDAWKLWTHCLLTWQHHVCPSTELCAQCSSKQMCVKRCVHCALMCQTLEGIGTGTQHCRLLTLGQSCTDFCQTRWLTKLDKDMKDKLTWLEFRLTLGCVFNSPTLPSVTRAVLLNLQAKPIPDHWSWADDAAMKNSTLGWHLCVWCLCGSHLSPTSAACTQEASEVAKTQTHWFHLLFSEGTHGASRGQTTWKEGRKERRKEGSREGGKGRKEGKHRIRKIREF